MPDASPGWYPDAVNNVQRYWDGTGWTDKTQPMFDTPPGSNNTAPLPPIRPRDERPWWRKKRFFIPGGVLTAFILLVVLVAIFVPAKTPSKNAAASIPPLSTAPSTTTATTPATSSVASTPAPAPTTARSTPKPTPKPAPTTSAKRTTSAAAPDDGSFTMPNEVGNGLQAAQDDIQRVSGDPVFVSHSHDLIGSRFQIFDRDWQVCSQNLRPGTTVSAIGHIDFGVVKVYESCP